MSIYRIEMLVWYLIISNVQQYRWRYKSLWIWIENIKHWCLARRRPLPLLQNLLVSNKDPHKSPSRCWSSLLVPVSVPKTLRCQLPSPQAPHSTSKPSRSFLRLSLKFFSNFDDALLPKFDNLFERRRLITWLQHLEFIFSVARVILRAWSNILCVWGQKTWVGCNIRPAITVHRYSHAGTVQDIEQCRFKGIEYPPNSGWGSVFEIRVYTNSWINLCCY